MVNIRITYTGILSLIIGLVTIFTSLIYMIIVTRTLSIHEYGTWGLISGLLIYIIANETILSYWAIRENARNIDSGKTSLISSGVFSIVGMIVYLIIAEGISHDTGTDYFVLLFAVILVPVSFINKTLTGICLGQKPHAVSFGNLMFGITQIPSAIFFVYFMEMGVHGVILSIFSAYIAKNIVLGIYSKDRLKGKISLKKLKKWIKYFWIPIYPAMAVILYKLDILVFSTIMESVEGIAFWTVSFGLGILITNSALMSRGLYSKLLQDSKISNEEKIKYVKENLGHFFYFLIPATAIVIVFSKPGLIILNPIYEEAQFIVIVLAIHFFFYTLSSVLQSIILGTETIDENQKSTFKQFLKSKLFFVPTISLIQFSIHLIVLTVFLLFNSKTFSLLDLVMYWAIIASVVQIPFTIYYYHYAKKSIQFTLDIKKISQYLIITIMVFGLTFFVMDKYLIYSDKLIEFFPNVIIFVSLGIGLYFIITYSVDKNTRKLISSIFREISN
jgi:O-antigen/teichoic acid export membrane protein